MNSRLVDSLDIAARGWDPPVFSLPAVALAAGKLMKLDPERLTHAVEDPILTARVGGAVPTRVTAILLDGQRISREIDHAPGFAARPMNRDEIERKFRGNVGKRWDTDRTDRILRTLWALDRTDDLPSLLGELALPT